MSGVSPPVTHDDVFHLITSFLFSFFATTDIIIQFWRIKVNLLLKALHLSLFVVICGKIVIILSLLFC